MSVFAELRARVPLADVFSMYGLHPNRAGFVCCPLHKSDLKHLVDTEVNGDRKPTPCHWTHRLAMREILRSRTP